MLTALWHCHLECVPHETTEQNWVCGGLLRRAPALALGRGPAERGRVCTREAELMGRQPQTKRCLLVPATSFGGQEAAVRVILGAL